MNWRERKADIVFILFGVFIGLLFVVPHPDQVEAPPEMSEPVVWIHQANLERADSLGTADEQVFYIAMSRAGWTGTRHEIIKFGYSLCPLFDHGDPIDAAYPDVFMMAALSDAQQTICREETK